MIVQERLKGHFRLSLGIVAALLCIIGLVNLYGATFRPDEAGLPPLFGQQILWMGLGWLLLVAGAIIDYQFWGRVSYGLFGLYLLLMVAVLFLGREVGGHRSWLELGPIHLQPTEVGKVILPIVLAKIFAQHPSGGGYYLRELIVPAGLVSLAALLNLAQHDLGGTVFYILIFVSLLMFAGLRRSVVIALCISCLVGGAITYRFVLNDAQRARIASFANPQSDPQGRGYHIAQAKIAIGSGWIAGKGFLQGVRHQLHYVPARHTDFIFTVLGEEWGFIGTAATLLLYLSLILFGMETAIGAKERFGFFLAIGLVASLFWQVAMNLFGVLGLIPLTGVTLPFLSYGGSSLVVMLAAVGLLLSIRTRRFMF